MNKALHHLNEKNCIFPSLLLSSYLTFLFFLFPYLSLYFSTLFYITPECLYFYEDTNWILINIFISQIGQKTQNYIDIH